MAEALRLDRVGELRFQAVTPPTVRQRHAFGGQLMAKSCWLTDKRRRANSTRTCCTHGSLVRAGEGPSVIVSVIFCPQTLLDEPLCPSGARVQAPRKDQIKS
jgi:hypothetical protein